MCEWNRLTGACCSGSQNNGGWGEVGGGAGQVQRVEVFCFFFDQGPGSLTPAAWTRGTWTPKDAALLTMKNLFDKGQHKHPSAEWQRSGGMLACHMAGFNTGLCCIF